MCQVCALAARYQRIHKEESLVFDLSQFSTVLEVKPTANSPPDRPNSRT
ncbi:MAG TPA: hypothetical protein V6C65_21750 [Allocoleopsis sp.]